MSRLLVAFPFLFFACFSLASAGGEGARKAEGDSTRSRVDLTLYPPDLSASSSKETLFRFLPDGPLLLFDRPLTLSAAPGEERRYLVETKSSASTADKSIRREYIIDKRAPQQPKVNLGSSVLAKGSELAFTSEVGTQVRYAILSVDSPASSASTLSRREFASDEANTTTAFLAYDSSHPPLLVPPAEDTRSITMIAFAQDEAGNRSSPLRVAYRAAAPGMRIEAPKPESARLPISFGSSAQYPPARLRSEPGRLELRFLRPIEGELLAAVEQSTDETDEAGGKVAAELPREAFHPLATAGDDGVLSLSCPYGWSGRVHIRLAIRDATGLRVSPEIVSAEMKSLPPEASPRSFPPPPFLEAGPSGGPCFVFFPSADRSLVYSIDGSPFVEYGEPILIEPDKSEGSTRATVSISYKFLSGEADSPAEEFTTSLDLPPVPPIPRLEAPAFGALLAVPVNIRPLSAGVFRYEIAEGGVIPPEPNSASPPLGEGLLVDCPEGSSRDVSIRVRGFAGKGAQTVGGEGAFLRFSIDRTPPEAPALVEKLSTWYPQAVKVLFRSVPDRIFASISSDGASADFMEVPGSLSLSGRSTTAVSYVLRAYSVDAAGNRSAEMKPVSVIVDRVSIYARATALSPSGDPVAKAADGSPDRPYPDLSSALAAADREGRRVIKLRGAFFAKGTIRPHSDLAIVGGYGEDWGPESGSRATIEVVASPGQPSVDLRSFGLALRGLAIAARGSGAIFESENGRLEIEDSSVDASSPSELVIIRARDSKISLLSSSFLVSNALSCAIVEGKGVELKAQGSSFSASGQVKYYSGISLEGGTLSLNSCLVDSAATLGVSLLDLRRASAQADRCMFAARGGSGFLRIGLFDSIEGEIRNSRASVSWTGNATLFETTGNAPAFTHVSFRASTSGGMLRFFSAVGGMPRLVNSIFSAEGGDAELLKADRKPLPGELAADCVFGFARYLTGAFSITDLKGLNALNASLPSHAVGRVISESPVSTFVHSVKSGSGIAKASACVDAALVLQGAYERDFLDYPRPSAFGRGLPDIGADEYRE